MSHQTIVIREEDTTLVIEQVTVPSRISSKITLPVGGDPFTFCDENGGLLLTLDEDGNIISEKGFFELSGQAEPAVSPAGKMRLYFDSGINKLLLSEDGSAYAGFMDGAGDLSGPASATDNALARYNGTTGKLVQNSLVTVDDSGNLLANASIGEHLIGNFGINSNVIRRLAGGQIDFGFASTMDFLSDEIDNASAVAFNFDIITGGGLSTAGAKLFRIRNNSVDKFVIDKDGSISVRGTDLQTGSGGNDEGYMLAAASVRFGRRNSGDAVIVHPSSLRLVFQATPFTYAVLRPSLTGTVDEVFFDWSASVNKAVSGNYTGIKLDVTEIATVGSDNRLLDIQVGSVTQFNVRNNGLVDYTTPDALGAGGAATLGLIGGTGPTVAAQNQWLKIKINGTDHWLPVWV